jgi:hypothetical protein
MQFPMDLTSHLHIHYIANDSCACEYFKTHNNEPNFVDKKKPRNYPVHELLNAP